MVWVVLTKKQNRIVSQVQAALNLQAAQPRINKPVVVVKAKQPQYAAQAQVLQAMIDDAFFQNTPLLNYLRGKQQAPFSGGPFVGDDDMVEIHEDGVLCWNNPHCEKCYA